MTSEIEGYRRAAKRLKKAHAAGAPEALARAAKALPRERLGDLKHVDALHVVAREAGSESWPRLKLRLELKHATPEQLLRRLRAGLEHGFHWAVREVLARDPSLGRANLGIAAALYDAAFLRAELADNPKLATTEVEGVLPLCHLAFSQWIKADGAEAEMLACAEMLQSHGADVNVGKPEPGGSAHQLSPLYGAIGHADNLTLGRWLLQNGANPNDGESLYHATEHGHRDGLRLLLEHGAQPAGTNAMLRALDFDDLEAVRLLLKAGADPDEGCGEGPSGEFATIPGALHHAGRRLCCAEMAELLVAAGASLSARWHGRSPYGTARIYGNAAVARTIAAAGGATALTPSDALLAQAAEGRVPNGARIDPEILSGETRGLISAMAHLPAALPQIKAMVALGLEWDRPDGMGVPPVQTAGWHGVPEVMEYLLSLGPDLTHVNTWGGDLLGTILHGSANAPDRERCNHLSCVDLALQAGLPLYRGYLLFTGNEAVAEKLLAFAEEHPERVLEAAEQGS